jgi:uncharacterized membrane protein (GlpM family)
MHDVAILAIKGVVGGGLVVVFALLSEALSPKRFAGLFSAAPSVALASLAVTLLDKGSHDARQSTLGMLAGVAGMVAYAAMVIGLLKRLRAWRAAAAAMAAWLGVAAAVAVPVVLR